MPARVEIPVGSRFERLITTEERVVGVVTLACVCDCGRASRPWIRSLLEGRTTSCGCRRDEVSRKKATKHGHAGRTDGTRRSREYECWVGMRKRCLDPAEPAYRHYGGRGVVICARWRDDFAAFLADMGPRPAGTSIDRVDNDGDYEPGNCRWATHSEQNRNRRAEATRWSREGPRDERGRLLPKTILDPAGAEHVPAHLLDVGEAIAA